MNCVDCLNFKMKKGWEEAFCSVKNITVDDGKQERMRYFKWDGKNGKNLIERSVDIVTLNRSCSEFDFMGGELK